MLQKIFLDVENDSYALYAPYKYRDAVRGLGGRWNAYSGCWVIPAGHSTIEQLQQRIPDVQLSVAVQQRARDRACAVDSQRKLATLRYGDGLDEYQKFGVAFLATAKRAVLADDIGLGKTAQAVRAVYEVGARRVLYVTRKSLICNTQQQIALWSPAGASPVEWTVTNYEQVVKNAAGLKRERFDVVIADEAHYAKNRKAKRTKALAAVTKDCPYVYVLTGRPVLNAPDELWSLLHIIRPKEFRSYWAFVEEYCTTEYNPWSGWRQVTGLKAGAEALLARDLAHVLLRRTKDAVALPALTRETVVVDLLPEQRAVYEQMEKEFIVRFSSGDYVYAPSALAQITRLRQITCSPALIGGKDVSAKTSAVADLVSIHAANHKILIFTWFADYAKMLAGLLKAPSITGDIPVKERDAAARRFMSDPDCRVLVMTYGAGSEGLNLQAASLIILADKDWVPATIEQAEGRAHRRGQNNPVHVISLVARDTVDAHVEYILERKDRVLRSIDAVALLIRLICGGDVDGKAIGVHRAGSG